MEGGGEGGDWVMERNEKNRGVGEGRVDGWGGRV